ncbi:MAG: hypothetical protein IKL04_09505 [Lachnospiraceae bacterium]|nr:hypothetical protein [Lachnospiraceae bacterium]
MDNEKELQQLGNRLKELAEKSFRQNIYTFSSFLGLSELDVFWRAEASLSYAGIRLNGGFAQADRQVVRFGRPEDLGYEMEFPIKCIYIQPLLKKFAEKLSHRDFLGALMNQGIDRSTLGDIKVGEGEAYLFCLETVADYICDNLTQIRHTHVKCSIVEVYEDFVQEEPDVESIQVSSMRLDGCISKVYNISRNDCLELFRTGKVFVDGRLCENNSKALKGTEVINVRGKGKFKLAGEAHETRKGKLRVEVMVYR